MQKQNYVYMLECGDGTLYTGWTNDIKKRLAAHNSGTGAKYTKARLPVKLAYAEQCESKQQAMRKECELKKLSRQQKLKLSANFLKQQPINPT